MGSTDANEDVAPGFGTWADTGLREAVEEVREKYDRDFEEADELSVELWF